MPADGAGFAVHGDAGEVADVLVGARESVEKRRLAAVLVPGESKGQQRTLRQRLAVRFCMIAPLLAEPGVVRIVRVLALGIVAVPVPRALRSGEGLNPDLRRIGEPQRQLIAVDAKLHRVAHRSELHQLHPRAGDDAHIQKMLPQRALAADRQNARRLAGAQFVQGHKIRFLSV